jgi:hypothetical protein
MHDPHHAILNTGRMSLEAAADLIAAAVLPRD